MEKTIKDAVFLYWKDRIIKDCQLYCSLKCLNKETYQPGQFHRLININGNPARETICLATKMKLVTDTYILHTRSARFRNIEDSALCLICEDADETVEHIILTCRVLEPIRQSVIDTIDSICTKSYGVSFFSLKARDRLQFIMDSSKVHETYYYKDMNSDHLSELEFESRRLCYLLLLATWR